MAGFCTNLDLFVKLRSGGDLKNHMFLYESIISFLTTEVSEEDKNRIKEFCRLFCVNLNQKWIESSRNQKTFMNRVINRKWLEKNINWPVCDSVDLRSVMGFSDAALSELVDIDCHVPTLAVCTAEAGTSTEKEHRKPFEELSNKQKKRRSTSIVEENSEVELQHWYITKLKDNGKTNLAKVVEYLSSNPDALSEVEERLFKKQSLSTVSEDKCLALYTSVALSKWKYLALRQFLKEENCAAFPSYPKLVNAKKRCYPPQESMEITENGAHIKLQALLDHTVERILLDINTVDRSQNEELKLTWKWGLDGSSSQSNYKQKTSNTATEFDDSSVVMISIVPLRLVSTRPSSGNENLVWENPTPCSTLYYRPVKFTFTSETADFIKSEESEMKKQIDERISTQCGNIIVSHELHMTMIDGKVANIIAGVPSYATCPICLAKPSEMNNLDALTSKPLREEIYKQGISSLHMKIRCMECLLHISYNLDFQRWTARGEHKALKQAKINTTQQEFREQTGMLIDIVKQGFGTTNDGNTARRFFQDYKRSSRITGIDENLIFRFSVILQAISSGKNIDCEKFRRYCRETADVYVQHYSWYYMPVSVHKLLMHGADICNHFGVLPITVLRTTDALRFPEAERTGSNERSNYGIEDYTRGIERNIIWSIVHNDSSDVQYRYRRSLQMIISQHFSETTVMPGVDVSLHCTLNGPHPGRFVWERDGIVISSNTDSRYTIGQTMAGDGGVITQLNISHLRVDDGGLFACVAHHGDNVVFHHDRLNVYGPPYIRTLPPFKVQSGQSVTLKCPYYGYPVRQITWEYKGKEISTDITTQSNRFKRSANKPASIEIFGRKPKLREKRDSPIVSNDGILNVPKVSKTDNGASYSCIVRSPSGEMAKRSFELHVVEAPQLEEILLPTDLQEGQIVQIHCNLKSGDSPVYYSWLKDGKKIPTHLKIVERSLEVFSVLIIKNVSLDHCGTYTCVAANHVAKVNRTVNLYIKVAPKWSEEPQNSSLLLGRGGHISCSANGYPQPQTHWLKKDIVSETWRPVLEVAGGGVLSLSNGSLIFDSVALSDAGLYTCHVENGVGEALSKTVWISVNKPVTFDVVSRNMTAKLGQQVTVECQAKGDDPIRIMWTRNGKPINPLTQRVKISEVKSEDGMTSILEILQTETSDGALYQCRAGNPFGADVYSVHLTILEPPAPPTDLSVDSIKSRSVKLSWRDMARSLAQFYVLQISNSQRLSWTSARIINITRLEELRHTLEVDDLLPATSYTARVAGGNQADLSHYSTPVRFTTTEEAPSSPPLGVQLEQTDSPGELRVRWLPPPADSHNGLIIGYRLKAVPQLTGIKETEETSDKTIKTASLYAKQETIVSGLLKGVRYAVSVAAFNSAGSGPFSVPLFQDTREGAPEEGPSSVECGGVTSTALRVSWQPIPPHKQAGALIGYTVLYAAQGRQWMNSTSLVTELRLQGLYKFTNYTVKVAGFSNYGLGPFSFPIICSTLQDVPEAPAEIKLLSQSSTTLLVSWKRPRQPNGRLLHYTVYCKPTASNDGPQAIRVDVQSTTEAYEKSQTLELKGLIEGRQYDVWVTSSTAVGEGPESRRVTNTPSQRVVAGVASLGGEITEAVRNSLLLECKSVGSPPPRTVWYHNQNIITHHPRFTRNRDDSLLIKSIDQSLSGNYTCLAKNLYGSDSVVYTVKVLPLPDPPTLRATPYKDYIVVEWDEIRSYGNDSVGFGISYNLTWRENDGLWQEAWPVTRENRLPGVQSHTLAGLKCGTKYSVRVTATDSIGTSAPAHIDVTTLGGAPVSPPSTDWLWSNATHIYIQLSGWDDSGCDVIRWEVEYRLLGSTLWQRAENKAPMDLNLGWSYIEGHYQAPPLRSIPTSYAVGTLAPANWYQLRVTAINDAGTASTVYTYATKTLDGEEIGPPSELFDLNMLVIICSSILLVICLMAFFCILFRRHRQNYSSQYRHSIADEVKSRNESVASQSEHKDRYAHAPRIYTSPVHNRKSSKNEMFEISPYAEFALGFRTFDHVENQDLPSRLPSRPRFDTETSFQTRSESDDSDSTSKATAVSAMPRRHCRTPHHR